MCYSRPIKVFAIFSQFVALFLVIIYVKLRGDTMLPHIILTKFSLYTIYLLPLTNFFMLTVT